VQGRKLMGSAQSRRAKYVLQHGSLPLRGDITRLIDVLHLEAEEQNQLRHQLAAHACTLASALGIDDNAPSVQFDAAAQAIAQGFAATLNLSFQRSSATSQELQCAARLIREQYANVAWTESR
jgi:lipoyl(octanoyl) transferase